MKLIRLALAALLFASALSAHAQDYPTKPVRILIPYAAGGGVDAAARLVAQHFTTVLGQNFIVESRPGGNTVIATEAVARSAPDGHTLLITGGSTMTLLPLTHTGKLPFDPLADFAPVGMVSRLPFFLVTASSQPYKTAKELLDDARAKGGSLAYASNGIGSMAHVGTEMLVQSAGAKMIHAPYNGFTPAIADLVTGRVAMVMVDLAPINGQLQAKTLRPLAVASTQRSRFMPDVPTLAEAGYPNNEFEVWLALYAPAKTPPAVLQRLSGELAKFLNTPAAREAFAKLGHESDAAGPDVVRQRIVAEQKAFAPAVKAAGLASPK
jgi:tripartite-type tricarboxylate transporter receptor subunit TctC